jgi:high-affinity nickel-transport protein
MLSTFGFAFLGFLLGMRHAVDPDHVVAVTTIASTEPSLRRAARIGLAWGVGHTATILLVGGAIILFRVALSPRVGLALEFVVAVMLVVLGIAAIFGHGSPSQRSPSVRPLLVGMVHGLAGSAAVALLALAAVRDPGTGMAYLLLCTCSSSASAPSSAWGSSRPSSRCLRRSPRRAWRGCAATSPPRRVR